MYHQGGRVSRKKHPAAPLPQKTLDSIEFNSKAEAHRLALENIDKPWARRWLKATGKSF